MRASVLICPWIQRHGCMQWPARQLQPMSSLFPLDVNGLWGGLKSLNEKAFDQCDWIGYNINTEFSQAKLFN